MAPEPAPIVAVHTPKAAGTTLKHHFEQAFDERELQFDYTDDPADPSSAWNLDPERFARAPITSIAPHRIVFGHFAARKYGGLRDAFRLTFLRHPVDNVISIYRFWMKHGRDEWQSPLFRYVRGAELSLERFAELPLIRYLYSRVYFADGALDGFAFVGDHGRFDDELARLGAALGVTFDPAVHLNPTDASGRSRAGERPGRAVLATLTRLLADDIELYEAYRGR